MLLKELKQFPKRPVDDTGEYGVDTGKYIGIRFEPETKEKLKSIVAGESIPNATEPDDYHSTIAYSRGSQIPGYQVAGKMKNPIEAKIKDFGIFPSQDGCNCLVAKLDAPDLVDMHNKTREHGATHDYDEYIPHVTLSYDAGDWDEESLADLTRKYAGTKLYGNEEYENDIIEDWKNKYNK